jgi:hypothetical protein
MPGFAGGGGDAGTGLLGCFVSWWPGSSGFRFALFYFACLLCLLLAAYFYNLVAIGWHRSVYNSVAIGWPWRLRSEG